MSYIQRLVASAVLFATLASTAVATNHTVKSGDNDWTIAKKYGLTVQQLHKLNPNTDWNKLKLGQSVKVSSNNSGIKPASKPAEKTTAKASAKPAAKATAKPASSIKSTGAVAKVTKTDVIVRSEPSTNGDRKALIGQGKVGAVLERRSGWTKVKFSADLIGWVRDDMVSVTSPAKRSGTVAKAAPKKVESNPVAKLPETPTKTDTVKTSDAELQAKKVDTVETNIDSKAPKTTTESIVITNEVKAKPEQPVQKVVKAPALPPAIDPRYADKVALITADTVIVRSGPSTKADKKVTVSKGRTADVLTQRDGWTNVKFSGGTIGWIRNDLLKVVTEVELQALKEKAKAEAEAAAAIQLDPDATKVEKMLATAKSKTGTRYVWGASRSSAFDCSGFVLWTMSQHGISLPRTAAQQAGVGTKVTRDNLQAGDLVFFQTTRGNRISHVGIYIGGGNFIHASSGGGKVQTNSLSEGYYNKRFVTARRLPQLSK